MTQRVTSGHIADEHINMPENTACLSGETRLQQAINQSLIMFITTYDYSIVTGQIGQNR